MDAQAKGELASLWMYLITVGSMIMGMGIACIPEFSAKFYSIFNYFGLTMGSGAEILSLAGLAIFTIAIMKLAPYVKKGVHGPD